MKMNGLKVEHRKLAELTPAPWNPRRISDHDVAALKRSLSEFGTVEPILVNEVTGHVVGGHQRLVALLANGETETDVLVGSWPEDREKALNIALNKISGEFDTAALSDLLTELQSADFDIELTGFGQTEIDNILSGMFAKGANDINAEWKGMPEFNQEDKESFRDIIVHFKDQQAVDKFAALTNQKLTPKTKFIWFPQAEIERYSDKEYRDES